MLDDIELFPNARYTTFELQLFNTYTLEFTPRNRGAICSVEGNNIITMVILDGEDTYMFTFDHTGPITLGNFVAYLLQAPFLQSWDNPYEPVSVLCSALRHHVQKYFPPPFLS